MWTRALARSLVLPTFLAALPLGAAPPPRVEAAVAPARTRSPLPACSDLYWLALVPDVNTPTGPRHATACPSVDGWNASALFEPPLDQPLFCRYSWSKAPSPPDPSSIARLTSVETPLRGTVRLCAVLYPLQAMAAQDALDSELLNRELRFQVGATELPLPAGQPSVRLAVVDTEPTGAGLPTAPPPTGQRSPHGFDIALIAHDLTCARGCNGPRSAAGSCAASIGTRLALPLSSPAQPPGSSSSGGFFGRPSDLALAIVREVGAWAAAGAPQHLILNLSVGWDPDMLPRETRSGLNAEELAVYAALAYARSQGALPIAASGNSPGGSQPGEGATAPARWYAGAPATGGLLPLAADPVVWAIGAIDRDERPLANVRAGSLPPLLAYGDHAVAPVPGGGWTDPLTGSSVSAVVASSIAAAVWDLRPGLSAEQVMALLERSARPLPHPAELYSGGAPPPMRQLLFHAALSRAWSRERLYTDQSSWASPQTVSCSGATPLTCPNETFLVCPAQPPAPLATCPPGPLQSIGSVPWVLPQPGQDPCPTCSVTSTSQYFSRQASSGPSPSSGWHFYLEIPATWTGGCLTDAVVELAMPGSPPQRLKFLIVLPKSPTQTGPVPPNGKICPGESLLVTGLPSPVQAPATITFRLVDQPSYSVRSPLYVDWQP